MARKTIKVFANKIQVFTPLTFYLDKHPQICKRLMELPDSIHVATVIRDMCVNGVGAPVKAEEDAEPDMSGLGAEI